MGVWEIIIGALVLLLSVIMIIVIILQEGHDAGLGTITGGADSFMKRGKAKTADAVFAKVTKFVAVGFFILVVVLNAISYFGGKNSNTNGNDAVITETSATETSDASTESSKEESAEASKTESSAASAAESEQASAESKAETSTTSAAETSTASEDEAPVTRENEQ